jgi:hypothetical protein
MERKGRSLVAKKSHTDKTHKIQSKQRRQRAPSVIEATMVLHTRRTSAPSGKRVMMDDDDDNNNVQAGAEIQRRSFPATPHPSKKRRLEDESSTPPTGSSAGAESATTADTQETEPFIEVSKQTCDFFLLEILEHSVLLCARCLFSHPCLVVVFSPLSCCFLVLVQSMLASDIESPPRIQDEEEQDDDIDWDKLAQSEPAATDIPIFLGAHSRKEAANERFAAILDECHSSLHECVDALLQTVADVHNLHSNQMEAMEADIKHNLVCNDEARAQMQLRLQESATAAQGLFAKLLQRVTEPLHQVVATNKMQEAMAPESIK